MKQSEFPPVNCLVNAVRGQVGPGTDMDGLPTYRDLAEEPGSDSLMAAAISRILHWLAEGWGWLGSASFHTD